jgi:hypothetical protein
MLEAETRELRELLDDKNKSIALLANKQSQSTSQEDVESRKRSHTTMAATRPTEENKAPATRPNGRKVSHSPRPSTTKAPQQGMPQADQQHSWAAPDQAPEHPRKQRKAAPTPLMTAFEHPSISSYGPRTPSVQGIDQGASSATAQDQFGQQSMTYPTPRSEIARSPTTLLGFPTPVDSTVLGVQSCQRMQSDRVAFSDMNFIPYSHETNAAPGFPQSKSEPRLRVWEGFIGTAEGEPLTVYDTVYGAPRVDVLLDGPHLKSARSNMMADPGMAMQHASWAYHHFDSDADHSDSVMSFSPDDCLSTGEDLATEWASASSCHEDGTYNSIMLSDFAPPDSTVLDTVLAL